LAETFEGPVKRTINRLSARQVETLKKLGRHADGGNLYLKVTPDGRRWVFLYSLNGKQREMGLGSAAKGGVSLVRFVAIPLWEGPQPLQKGFRPKSLG
jgi:hypothetical protein